MIQKENQVLVGQHSANDPFGPIKYPGINVVVNHEGIQARNFVFTGPRRKSDPWVAHWIWLNNNVYPDYQKSPFTRWQDEYSKYRSILALFRKEVKLNFEPRNVTAWVSADTKYRLYINGKMVGRGPLEAEGDWGTTEPPEHWYYDFYNLTQYFKKENIICICAEVFLKTDIPADFSMGRGGFIFEAKVANDEREEVIKTDNTWRGIPNQALVDVGCYDARKEPVDWRYVGFDDSQWPYVTSLGIPPGGCWNLMPREIPPLMEAQVLAKDVIIPDEYKNRIENPLAMITPNSSGAIIKPGSPITFWIDFGREVVGYPKFIVKGTKGTRIKMKNVEVLGKDHPMLRSESYILREGVQSFEAFRLSGFQYLQITIDNIDGPLEIKKIGNTFTSYPVEYKGEFTCSDDLLNEIWKVGRWTTQLCMQSYHLDSPIHQEPLSDPGDYLIESLINYYTFGDPWLVRQDLLKIARILEKKRGIMFHTSYSLLWIQMLKDYYNYTDDKELLKDVALNMHNLLDLFDSYRGTSGLIENPPNYMFMDWTNVNGFTLHHPPKVIGYGYMNAFYYKALKDAAYISRVIGEDDKADHYEKIAKKVATSFNEKLWVDERGLYCDGRPTLTSVSSSTWLPADIDKIYFSQHTNALTVAYDIAPRERQEEIVHRIIEDKSLIQAQPYFMHFIFEALHHSNQFDRYGLDQIRRWKKLLDEHPTSWKETWNWGDYSHAWSGTPTYQLSSKVLGVTPARPGFDVVSIRPIVGDLKWAHGKVPTPHGSVSVSWIRDNSGFEENVSIPVNSKAKVSIPKIGLKNVTIKVNGKIIWKNHSYIGDIPGITNGNEDSKYVTFDVGCGAYRFKMTETN